MSLPELEVAENWAQLFILCFMHDVHNALVLRSISVHWLLQEHNTLLSDLYAQIDFIYTRNAASTGRSRSLFCQQQNLQLSFVNRSRKLA